MIYPSQLADLVHSQKNLCYTLKLKAIYCCLSLINQAVITRADRSLSPLSPALLLPSHSWPPVFSLCPRSLPEPSLSVTLLPFFSLPLYTPPTSLSLSLSPY